MQFHFKFKIGDMIQTPTGSYGVITYVSQEIGQGIPLYKGIYLSPHDKAGELFTLNENNLLGLNEKTPDETIVSPPPLDNPKGKSQFGELEDIYHKLKSIFEKDASQESEEEPFIPYIYDPSSKKKFGEIGSPTLYKDIFDRPLFIGDVIELYAYTRKEATESHPYVTEVSNKYYVPIVQIENPSSKQPIYPFIVGIASSCSPDGSLPSQYRIRFVRSWTQIQENGLQDINFSSGEQLRYIFSKEEEQKIVEGKNGEKE